MTPATADAQPTDACGPAFRLGYFVLVSLVLHGLALVFWRGEPPAGPVGRSTFQITVLARHGDSAAKTDAEPGLRGDSDGHSSGKRVASSGEVSAVSATEEHKPRQATELTASRRPVHRSLGRPQQPAARTHAGGGKASANTAAQETNSSLAARQPASPKEHTVARAGANSHGHERLSSSARYRKVRAALQEALLPRFDYPSVARRRGWQGRVRIALHVEADGDLTGIQLLESSGYPLLDRAAVKNVTELRTVPAVTQWLGGNDMDVILPVRYQLQAR